MKRYCRMVCAVALLTVSLVSTASAQERWQRGQNIQPVFEGWERNTDGSFTMVFGYLNRNYEEQPFIPVGPDNFFEPALKTRASQPIFITVVSSSFLLCGFLRTGMQSRTSPGL